MLCTDHISSPCHSDLQQSAYHSSSSDRSPTCRSFSFLVQLCVLPGWNISPFKALIEYYSAFCFGVLIASAWLSLQWVWVFRPAALSTSFIQPGLAWRQTALDCLASTCSALKLEDKKEFPLQCLLTFSLENRRIHTTCRVYLHSIFVGYMGANNHDSCAHVYIITLCLELSKALLYTKQHKFWLHCPNLSYFFHAKKKKRWLVVIFWAKQYKNGYFILRILPSLTIIDYNASSKKCQINSLL